MDIKKTLLLAGLATTLSGCSWIFPISPGSDGWGFNSNSVEVTQRSRDSVQMPTRMEMAMARVEAANAATNSSVKLPGLLELLPANSEIMHRSTYPGHRSMIKASADKRQVPSDTKGCEQQQKLVGEGLRASIDERIALYMVQTDSLSESSLEPKVKARLMHQLGNEFRDLEKKSKGLTYLQETLNGLCQMHNLGLIETASYNDSTKSLLRTAATNLQLRPIGTKLTFSTDNTAPLQKASLPR